ncbi:lipid A-modifier LpxR family protein [Roseivivax sp. CAU 1753]
MTFQLPSRAASCVAGLCVLIASVLLAPEAAAQDRTRIGYGRLIVNDSAGELKDRWQTGSFMSSRVWGYGWDGQAPDRPGALIELRFNGQIIAPANLRDFNVADRLYAGSLSLGAHTHFNRHGTEIAIGADLVMTGPQTHLDDFQNALHDLLNVPRPSDDITDVQIEDGFHPTLVAEAGRSLSFGQNGRVRPFTELRWGVETLARVGVDVTFGAFGVGELLARDPVTGTRYQIVSKDPVGTSLYLGADVAQVASSAYLPDDRGPKLEQSRTRLRAGLNWQGESWGVQYGVTYLSEEFEGQPEGQFLGAARIKYNF